MHARVCNYMYIVWAQAGVRVWARMNICIYIYVCRLYVCAHACLDLCVCVCAIVGVRSHAYMYTVVCVYARLPIYKLARSCVVNDCWPWKDKIADATG